MKLDRLLDRAVYVLTSPVSFLRLMFAKSANFTHRLTMSLGPRRVTCCLCGWQGRKFDYFLEREFVTRGSQCPGCGSQTRNRKLAEFLDREFELNGKRVLDIAPHPLYRDWFCKRGAQYLSMDLGERPAMVKMDATRMAFPDECFDLVICSHVLEHVPDYGRALAEIRRVLAVDGRAVIDVPFGNSPASLPLAKPDHQGHCHCFGWDI